MSRVGVFGGCPEWVGVSRGRRVFGIVSRGHTLFLHHCITTCSENSVLTNHNSRKGLAA